MKFKKFQWLREEAWKRLGEQSSVVSTPCWSEEDALRADVLTLAYIGDAVYSLYIRQRVLSTGLTQMQVLHTLVTDCINAKSQAKALQAMAEEVSEAEAMFIKRARNANVHVPRSATVQEYRWSTAFEAFIGYLSMTQQRERLTAVMEQAFQLTVREHQGPSDRKE